MENVVKMLVRTPERPELKKTAEGAYGQKDDFSKLLRDKTDLSQRADQTSDQQKPQKVTGKETESSKGQKEAQEADPAEQALEQAAALNLQQAALAYQTLSLDPDTDQQSVDGAVPELGEVTAAGVLQGEMFVEKQGRETSVLPEMEPEGSQVISQEETLEKEGKEAVFSVNHHDNAQDAGMENLQPSQGTEKTTAKKESHRETEEGIETAVNLQAGGAASRVEHRQKVSSLHQAEPRQEQEGDLICLQTGEETLPKDLGKALSSGLLQKKGELTVELEPASLGKLTIKVLYEGGRASVSIAATNPKTLEMLNEKAGELAGILEEKTGQSTIVYTQAAQQERGEYTAGQEGRRSGEDRHQEREQKKQESDNFAHQLRLGLV